MDKNQAAETLVVLTDLVEQVVVDLAGLVAEAAGASDLAVVDSTKAASEEGLSHVKKQNIASTILFVCPR